MNYSKGITWFDDCRIPFVDESDNNTTRERYDTIGYGSKMNNGWGSMDDSAKQGRFPANLLCSDDMLNDGIIYKSGDGKSGIKLINHNKNNFAVGEEMTFTKKGKTIHYGDKGSNSRYYDIDAWFNNLLENNIY